MSFFKESFIDYISADSITSLINIGHTSNIDLFCTHIECIHESISYVQTCSSFFSSKEEDREQFLKYKILECTDNQIYQSIRTYPYGILLIPDPFVQQTVVHILSSAVPLKHHPKQSGRHILKKIVDKIKRKYIPIFSVTISFEYIRSIKEINENGIPDKHVLPQRKIDHSIQLNILNEVSIYLDKMRVLSYSGYTIQEKSLHKISSTLFFDGVPYDQYTYTIFCLKHVLNHVADGYGVYYVIDKFNFKKSGDSIESGSKNTIIQSFNNSKLMLYTPWIFITCYALAAFFEQNSCINQNDLDTSTSYQILHKILNFFSDRKYSYDNELKQELSPNVQQIYKFIVQKLK